MSFASTRQSFFDTWKRFLRWHQFIAILVCINLRFAAAASDETPVVLQPLVHYGFIPCIVILGMTYTEPKPSLLQLLGPM